MALAAPIDTLVETLKKAIERHVKENPLPQCHQCGKEQKMMPMQLKFFSPDGKSFDWQVVDHEIYDRGWTSSEKPVPVVRDGKAVMEPVDPNEPGGKKRPMMTPPQMVFVCRACTEKASAKKK